MDPALQAGDGQDAESGISDRAGSRGDIEEAPTTDSFAAINAQHRGVAMCWPDGKPFGKLVLQRLFMESMRQLLASQFELAGSEWALRQHVFAVKGMTQDPETKPIRQYRLAIATESTLEQKLVDQAEILVHKVSMWSL